MGVPLIPEDVHYAARSDMAFGAGVELPPDTLFQVSAPRYAPSLLHLMKVSSKEELGAAKVSKSGPKIKVPFFVTLLPVIAEACQETDMTPAEVFTTTVEYIKAKGDPTKKKEVETVVIDTDDGTDARVNEVNPPEA